MARIADPSRRHPVSSISSTPVVALTDGESGVPHLLGNRVTGLERRLLGYLAGVRDMLKTREVSALAHLCGKLQYSDCFTKDDSASVELSLSYLYSGDMVFQDPKQTWDRIAWGREQLVWAERLKALLKSEPLRLRLLLEKGTRRAGAV